MQPLTCSLASSPTCEGCWSSISAGGLVVDNARFATSDPPPHVACLLGGDEGVVRPSLLIFGLFEGTLGERGIVPMGLIGWLTDDVGDRLT